MILKSNAGMEEELTSKNIALIGLRGSGKSTLGRLLARKLKRHFIDMDQELEFRKGLKISEWVQKEGWEPFREAEEKLLQELTLTDEKIIATGGGVVLSEKSREILQSKMKSVYLHWPEDILVERIEGDASRPSLKNGLTLKDEVKQLCGERDPLYRACAEVINCDGSQDVEGVLARMIELLKA